MPIPAEPKIYHIVHADRLPSIIAENGLLCDAEIVRCPLPGTIIGMNSIKQRRLSLPLSSHPDLHVGDCVPFYFCPRAVMLYVIYQANHSKLSYRGGQEPIVHLEADLHQAVAWAEEHEQRWAFTLGNAGAFYFEDRCDLAQLDEIDWNAVQAGKWSGIGIDSSVEEHKQAEFLIEKRFPWELVERIGVQSLRIHDRAVVSVRSSAHRPAVEIQREWYY